MKDTGARQIFAEAFGTLLLVATVIGSGIMAERLAGGNVAIALLGNTIPTGTILVVLITVLGPVSGAQFNPAVSLFFALRGEMTASRATGYILAQIAGGVLGTFLAHAMFGLAVFDLGVTQRGGAGQWIGEIVATAGLITIIAGGLAHAPERVGALVGLYITAAYWFTSSTSFANPAVTIARGLTPSFAGIAPGDVPGFVLAQMGGTIAALALAALLFPRAARA